MDQTVESGRGGVQVCQVNNSFFFDRSGSGFRRFVEAGLDPENCLRFATLREAAEGLNDHFGKGGLVLVQRRTTDHMARLFHAWGGLIDCWKETCSKRMLCDECWELGARPQDTVAAL